MKKFSALMLAMLLAVSFAACGGKNNENDTTADETAEQVEEVPVEAEEFVLPNNGEWDDILCSGDGYYLVTKEEDNFDGYKFLIGVVDSNGDWVHTFDEEGKFIEGVKSRVMSVYGDKVLSDSSCYAYLGDGVFLASPGTTLCTKDGNTRIGPWGEKSIEYIGSKTREIYNSWECLIWNVKNNTQVKVDAVMVSEVSDGYILMYDKDKFGNGTFFRLDLQGEYTKLPCTLAAGTLPIYSEGLFFACSENGKSCGFFDIDGNMVFSLNQYPPQTSGGNIPYFENGQATFTFKNNGGSVFEAVIDKTGEFIGEPKKLY